MQYVLTFSYNKLLLITSPFSLSLFLHAGIILSHLRYSSEWIQAASLLSPVIVDPENVYVHVLPFIAFETQIIIIDHIVHVMNGLVHVLCLQE